MGIVSSIAGRLRLRHPALRQLGRLAQLEQELSGWPGVLAWEGNAHTGSLLLHYDVTVLAQAECEQRASAALQELLAPAQTPGMPEVVPQAAQAGAASLAPASGPVVAPEPARAERPTRPIGSARVRANRWAKRGMLLSLAATLLLAAAGAKRWHTVGGLLFLHALGVHLWVHRRHLLK